MPSPYAQIASCYHAVRTTIKKLKWVEVGSREVWDVYWSDMSVSGERVCRLARSQVCVSLMCLSKHVLPKVASVLASIRVLCDP
jgi:hypothetical protein